MLISLLLLFTLALTACQSSPSPTPELPTPLPPTETSAPPTLSPTPAPTATPTEIPLAAGQCIQLIQNGDFETGSVDPWTFISNLGKPGIATFRPESGKYSVVLGDGFNADEQLQLDVKIPASAASVTFTFSFNGSTQETGTSPHDVLDVSLATTDGQILAPIQKFDNTDSRQSRGFKKTTHDLTAYAGQTVRIIFHAQTDAQNHTDFSIDNVSLEACGPAANATVVPTQAPAIVSTPTAAALGKGQCVEVVQNGNFETGAAAPWTESGNTNGPLVIEFPGRSHGKFSAFMGSASNLDQSLSQLVSIPATAASATLTYWWNRASHEQDGKPHDFLRVLLQDLNGKDLATLEEISNTTQQNFEFYQSTLDLSPYIGNTFYLVFHVTTDAQNDSDFSVDDVSLQACGPK